jgi:CRISPR/Cas system type I-B associated protein Csh2 (Cas7 group RAMP superfamily)
VNARERSPRWDLDVRLDDLEDGALARDVRLRVEQSLLDIFVPADRPEVVGFVVIERRFLAQPSVNGVRVCVDLNAVHVVVDVVAHGASQGGRPAQKKFVSDYDVNI